MHLITVCSRWIATCGMPPTMKAPGTVASLVTTVLIGLVQPPFWGLILFIGGSTLLGFWACYHFLRSSRDPDPPHVVIDEVVGQALASLLTFHSWKGLLLSFVLFRILDIWKPLAIGWVDGWFKKQKSLRLKAFGILADDLLAGVCVIFLISLYMLAFFPRTW